MKKIAIIAATLSCLCSCTIDIDWEYSGWSETKNETSQMVTLITTYPPGLYPETTETILPGESLKQYRTCWAPGNSVGESLTATIILADGSRILCDKSSDDSWSHRFYDNYETRKSAEWSHFQKHDITIETYHIDDELIGLWRKEQ